MKMIYMKNETEAGYPLATVIKMKPEVFIESPPFPRSSEKIVEKEGRQTKVAKLRRYQKRFLIDKILPHFNPQGPIDPKDPELKRG